MSRHIPGRARLNADGIESFTWATEAHIQTALAQLAHAYGWRVQTEVAVPGWGRLDLVLHRFADQDDYALVVEIKQELTKLSTIRKAFQQADGYFRWLSLEDEHAEPVKLAAAKVNWALINDIAYSYRGSVNVVDLTYVMTKIRMDAGPENLARARARAEESTVAARLGQSAVAKLMRDAATTERTHRRLMARRPKHFPAAAGGAS